jgi:hypothetical protein
MQLWGLFWAFGYGNLFYEVAQNVKKSEPLPINQLLGRLSESLSRRKSKRKFNGKIPGGIE